MVPLLVRIEQQLAATADPGKRGELLAEKACYLARMGDFEGAGQIVKNIRANSLLAIYLRVAVRVMLAEGLLIYFRDLNELARDRILRADAIATSAGISDLRCLTHVWLAHLDFEAMRIDSAVALVIDVLSSAASDDWPVVGRAAMVIADIKQYIGDRSEALRWYRSAHRSAVLDGDQVTIGALIYNKAAFAIAHARVSSHLRTDVDADELSFDDRELDSAHYFQAGTNVTALTQLVTLAKARALICRERYPMALEAIKAVFDDLHDLKDRPNNFSVVLDAAWCRYKIGDVSEAAEMVNEIAPTVVLTMDLDDAVVALSIVKHILGNGFIWGATSLQEQFEYAKLQYFKEISNIRAALKRLDGIEPV